MTGGCIFQGVLCFQVGNQWRGASGEQVSGLLAGEGVGMLRGSQCLVGELELHSSQPPSPVSLSSFSCYITQTGWSSWAGWT